MPWLPSCVNSKKYICHPSITVYIITPSETFPELCYWHSGTFIYFLSETDIRNDFVEGKVTFRHFATITKKKNLCWFIFLFDSNNFFTLLHMLPPPFIKGKVLLPAYWEKVLFGNCGQPFVFMFVGIELVFNSRLEKTFPFLFQWAQRIVMCSLLLSLFQCYFSIFSLYQAKAELSSCKI